MGRAWGNGQFQAFFISPMANDQLCSVFPFQAALRQSQGVNYGMLTHIHCAGLAYAPINFNGSHHRINQCSAELRAAGSGIYLGFTCLGNPLNQESLGNPSQPDDI